MTALTDLLSQMTQGDNVKKMSNELGANEQATGAAVAAALPLLLSALARNSSDPNGAQSLHRAIEQDHDGGVLDNLQGFLGNAQQGPGAGILRHVLGDRQPAAQNAVAQASGLDSRSVQQLMVMLAPLVLGALGRTQRQNGLDSSGLAGLLQGEKQQMEQKSPDLMGLATRLLDKDGDGSIVGEVTGMLGKMFGGR